MANTTIRKNSKEFKAVTSNTKGWTVSTLSNCFRAEAIENCIFDDFDLSHGVLRKSENGTYTFRIHSNLWYTFIPVSEPTPTEPTKKFLTVESDTIIDGIEVKAGQSIMIINQTVELAPNLSEEPAPTLAESPAPIETPTPYILDNLRDLAYNAHRNTSHFPEKRAESVVKDYSNELTQDLESMPEEQREQYKTKYIQLLKAYLYSKSNTASSFITGGSNFPVARNQKRMAWADAKYNNFREWRGKVLNAIEKRVKENRSPEAKLNDEWLIISSKITRSATTIKNIDLGIEKGYSRALFVNSITGLVKRLAHNGQTDLVNRSLDLITSLQANLKKPIITPSNSIWGLRIIAEVVREGISDKANADSETIPFPGGELITNHAADRVQIKHYSKPDQEVITHLKKCAFKWSPSQGVWQRKLTPQAVVVAKQLTGLR